MTYFVLGLPRSRTAWLSTWLTANGRMCRHDALSRVKSIDELRDLSQPNHGFVETAGSLFYRTLYNTFPDAKFAVVHRPEKQVAASLTRQGFNGQLAASTSVRMLGDASDYLRSKTRLLELSFDELNSPHLLALLWEHLREDDHDAERTQHMIRMRIEKIDPFWSAVPKSFLREEERLRQLGQ